jgi:thioredoxin-related protein
MLSLVLSLIVAAFASAEKKQSAQINWLDEYAQAQRRRQIEKRPMLVLIKSDGCSYCDKMVHTTYANDKVIQAVSDKYIPTSINATKNVQLAIAFGVRLYPTTIVVDAENRIIGRIEGYVGAEQLLRDLARITGEGAR